MADVHDSGDAETDPQERGRQATVRTLGRWHLVDTNNRRATRRSLRCDGDNYSDPPTSTSDAILAMDLKTGKLLWSKQLTENDAFNTGCSTPQRTNCPEAGGPDFDFGQPPILVSLGQGKRGLVIGQKSGMVHAVDPDQNGKCCGKPGPAQGAHWAEASGARLRTDKRST